MPVGVNLRVTVHCSQGGRKYMEDCLSVAYQSADDNNLEYAYFGVYDGHGGAEAAHFARAHLMDTIVKQKSFWSENDDDVIRAIREGFIATHHAMWKDQENWPKTSRGLPSTAGTTATIAFVRHGKLYIGHVGDSGLTLGYQEDGEDFWRAQQLTRDHKPECHQEKTRIMNSGGKVINKSGVPRVVWNRPRIGHKGPVTRSTPIDEIPFLAVARSLGDLWSYNSSLNEFVVSPFPDVEIVKIDPKKFRCLVFGTDGLWNVFNAHQAVSHVKKVEEENQIAPWKWVNPSKYLVNCALQTWVNTKLRADNITVVTVLIYPPGQTIPDPPSAQTMRQHEINMQCSSSLNQHEQMLRPMQCDLFNNGNLNTMHDLLPYMSDEEPYHSTSSMTAMTRSERNVANNYDINYMNSFAESYNSLYEHSHQNQPESLQQNQMRNMNHSPIEYFNQRNYYTEDAERYSLTKLQTRSEQKSDTDSNVVESCSSNKKCKIDLPHNLSLQFHNYISNKSTENHLFASELNTTAQTKPADFDDSTDDENELGSISNAESFIDNIDKLCESKIIESDTSLHSDSIQINEVSSSSPFITPDRPTQNNSIVNSKTSSSSTTSNRKSKIIQRRIIVTRSKDSSESALSTRTRSKTKKCTENRPTPSIRKNLVIKALPTIYLQPHTEQRRLSLRNIQSSSSQYQRILEPKRIITKSQLNSSLTKLPISSSSLASAKKSRVCKTSSSITTASRSTVWPSRIST